MKNNIGDMVLYILSWFLISELGLIVGPVWAQYKTGDREPRGSTHRLIEKSDLIDIGEAQDYVPPRQIPTIIRRQNIERLNTPIRQRLNYRKKFITGMWFTKNHMLS